MGLEELLGAEVIGNDRNAVGGVLLLMFFGTSQMRFRFESRNREVH